MSIPTASTQITEQHDDPEADYYAYSEAQQVELCRALADANAAIHGASRALFELIELDVPDWAHTTEGDDAKAHVDAAGQAIRAANRCAQLTNR